MNELKDMTQSTRKEGIPTKAKTMQKVDEEKGLYIRNVFLVIFMFGIKK